jgi:hypothetical protein
VQRYCNNRLILRQLTKYLICLLALIGCSGCSLVSKQYYYVPVTVHQTIKTRDGYFKMLRSQVAISDTSGKQLGSVTTSNGIGVPLFAGLPYLPVVPVGLVSVFYKGDEQFEMDVSVKSEGDFLTLAIDSDSYKKIRDSLNALHISTVHALKTTACYMIINGSKKVPLHVTEFIMSGPREHSYRLSADIRFGKVRTATIVTGNPLLDHTLKNVTFKRNARLTYCVLGFS